MYMPSGMQIANCIFVHLAFITCLISIQFLSSMKEIKENWALYRCNPMYMPMSDNIQQDFTYCVQDIQTGFMGHLLQPLTNITGSMTEVLSGFMDEIQSVREMIDKIRNMFSSITQSIFGVFMNLIIEFQKIIIGMKDLIGKSVGTMVSLMYIMDGSIKTMRSMWSGPPGQLVMALSKLNHCFHPDTQVKLKTGQSVCMKDLQLGDVLENGSVVEAVMKINNKTNPEPLYNINGIYVTGTHYIKEGNQFIQVANCRRAKLASVTSEWYSCLITSDHKIPIGKEIFWDWDDHLI